MLTDFLVLSQGYWSDVDEYYTRPPPIISIEHPAGTGSEVTHYFKLLFAAAFVQTFSLSLSLGSKLKLISILSIGITLEEL